MANNRMYLKCRKCGEMLILAKYYPTLTNGWYLHPNFSYERADDFLQDHSHGCEHDMHGADMFELELEERDAPDPDFDKDRET